MATPGRRGHSGASPPGPLRSGERTTACASCGPDSLVHSAGVSKRRHTVHGERAPQTQRVRGAGELGALLAVGDHRAASSLAHQILAQPDGAPADRHAAATALARVRPERSAALAVVAGLALFAGAALFGLVFRG